MTANRPLMFLLLAAGTVVTLSMGIRHGFGFFLPPMTQSFGWDRAARDYLGLYRELAALA